jgi:acyl-CoA dehydrogenase
MSFSQPAPQLANQYIDDRVLRSYLARTLSAGVLRQIEPQLTEMGELAGGPLYGFQLDDRLNLPLHTPFDAWGNRIDRVDVSPLWRAAEQLAARQGLVAIPYERANGAWSRVHQFALAYLFTASTDVYNCPLAMTDGAACALSVSGNKTLMQRALPHLTARDPAQFWTSGQWMTESTGGSDVALAETVARQDSDGGWRLYGRKWFTSAVASQMALTLARPEGNPAGAKGLALFYLETRGADGRLDHILVHRLKDKLGTRKVPTAELTLDGTRAIPVHGLNDGVKHIAPMLNITRTWNSVSAVGYMRRGVTLARDYARKRIAFGTSLAEKPLHVDTLAWMQAEFEAGELAAEEKDLLRLLTPIAKLATGKQSVAVVSEALECFGGAGYVEDTGLPMLLRDSQVFPIWEGTTNVLSLDALRGIGSGVALETFGKLLRELVQPVTETRLLAPTRKAQDACANAVRWLDGAAAQGNDVVEAGARRFALTLGRSLSLALLVRHAQWARDVERDERPLAAALRFGRHGVDLTSTEHLADSRSLALD